MRSCSFSIEVAVCAMSSAYASTKSLFGLFDVLPRSPSLMGGHSNGGKTACELPKTMAEYADDLNLFFNRFDKYDISTEVENLRISLSSQNDSNWNCIMTEEVRRIFTSQTPSKAAGLDKLSPRVLKLCSNQLA